MRRLTLVGLIALVATAGWFGGSLSVPTRVNEASAAAATSLYVNPGGSGHGVNLYCGWHATCLYPYPSGNGLDWANYAYEDVFWRPWGYTLSSLALPIAKVTVGNRNAFYTCKTSVADINRTDNLMSLGRTTYVHVDFLAAEGAWFHAYGKTSYANTTWGPIAEAADQEQLLGRPAPAPGINRGELDGALVPLSLRPVKWRAVRHRVSRPVAK